MTTVRYSETPQHAGRNRGGGRGERGQPSLSVLHVDRPGARRLDLNVVVPRRILRVQRDARSIAGAGFVGDGLIIGARTGRAAADQVGGEPGAAARRAVKAVG